MAEVAIRDARKSYGKTEVIHGLSCDIADGEFVVIVGPSGCGKSTLLRMVAGLETITAGDISIANEVVNQREPKDRNIAMVFQNYALYPHMSVYANMSYALRIAKQPKAEIDRRVQEAAAILQLGEYLDRRPGQLSGGQRQRVAMGRAIVREPAVFLFDEPLSNLDAKLRVQMRIEIRRLQKTLGTTSIYVTHDQVEAMTLADRLIVMNAGYAEQIGTPMDLYERPASAFVAGFIGSPAMNLLEARVAAGGIALPGSAALPVSTTAPDGTDLADGSRVTLGVRPEHIDVGAGTGGVALGNITVDLVEALGADTIVYGTVGSQPCAVRLPGKTTLTDGETLPLTATPEDLHAFDAATGKRLA